ncbi:TPA: hypothetical protein KQG29_001513 [Clostridioides difficile]|uniref:hypothetical protein n=1 Tax=Clostridioides sp. ZZV15-6597 TaxID=2811500 RepID=UPI001C179BA6|nr:hypothetical protein [Clostridioides sp. ZZV15-6597]HBG5344149.1 hypothetical protein [Clostridioides difficile]
MYRSLNSENAKEIMEKVAYLKACEENLKEYSLDGLSEAYDDFCKYGDKDIDKFIKAYNDFIYIEDENKADYLVILRFAQDLSDACDIRDYFTSRNKDSKLDGRWLSIKEIAEYLKKDYYIYIVKYINKRIEKEIESIDELREVCNKII